ncbi:MAG: DNA-processing protein DprA [Acidaminococcaceae bacterium]
MNIILRLVLATIILINLEAICTERYYLAALDAVYNLSFKKTQLLIEHFGSITKAYEANAEELENTHLVSAEKCSKILATRQKEYPYSLKEFCINNGVTILTTEDRNYPFQLKNIQNPPSVLYVKGTISDIDKTVGIVGSRKATSYGLKVAETFAQDLSLAGLMVISGGARGIDTAAHKGALKNDGKTIAVLGCGIDVIYPYENDALFNQISENGAIITEFPPGMKPLAKNFPARNRIISGLSQGILVVEAAHKSGAMITAEFALDEGREVYCVPGSIFSPTSVGTNSLIKQGAKLVQRPEDILEDFHLLLQKQTKVKVEIPDLFSGMSQDDKSFTSIVLTVLSFNEAKTLEEIVADSGLPLNVISTVLLNLQVNGYVVEQIGKRYIRL